ncbi:LOXH1 protein, partial [Donacobius atricapilla]|nr:LOXH1 protein [Donacobius atricapilla]
WTFFCIRTVSLGDLEKVLISHDGVGPGSGWFLDKIVIKHKEGEEAQEAVFPCNRYVIHGEKEFVTCQQWGGSSMKTFLKGQSCFPAIVFYTIVFAV